VLPPTASAPPSSAERPPDGTDWVHEIKHDGYRLAARRDPSESRPAHAHGHNWGPRYPLIVEAFDDTLAGSGEQRGTGAMLHRILSGLAAYIAVVVAVGLLFLAGASVYALMWPKPVVPFGQMGQ